MAPEMNGAVGGPVRSAFREALTDATSDLKRLALLIAAMALVPAN